MGGEGECWTTMPVCRAHGCCLWKSIRAGCDCLVGNVCFEVGSGDRVQFGMIGGVGTNL